MNDTPECQHAYFPMGRFPWPWIWVSTVYDCLYCGKRGSRRDFKRALAVAQARARLNP